MCSCSGAEPCPSLLLQKHMAELLSVDRDMAASFLNSVLNQLNWAFSEFIGMIQEVSRHGHVTFSPLGVAADGSVTLITFAIISGTFQCFGWSKRLKTKLRTKQIISSHKVAPSPLLPGVGGAVTASTGGAFRRRLSAGSGCRPRFFHPPAHVDSELS